MSGKHRQVAGAASGQVCTLLAADIAELTPPDRCEEIQLQLRASMYEVLRTAFHESGMPWEDCQRNDCGNGVVIAIPPGVPPLSVVGPLPQRLRDQLRLHNRAADTTVRMQMHAAVNIGPVYYDDHGFAGEDVKQVRRMLEVPQLHRALASSDSDLALIVSDHVYDTVISRASQPCRSVAIPSAENPCTANAGACLDLRTRVRNPPRRCYDGTAIRFSNQ